MEQHAKLAPSKAHRWIPCPGSIAFCDVNGIADTSSVFAEEGTTAHAYAAWLLKGAKPPVPAHDDEMIDYVSVYTDAIRKAAEGKTLMVEVPIDISMWTGEPDAKGTSDAIIIGGSTLEVHDLKYGRGVVVNAIQNEQLQVYALGALSLVEGLTGEEITDIKLVIHQPRRDHYSEWSVSRADLLNFGTHVKAMAKIALTVKSEAEIRFNLTPTPEACQWCPGKALCPALAEFVKQQVLNEFAAGNMTESVVSIDPAHIFDEEPVFIAAPRPAFPMLGKLPTPAVLEIIETWIGAMRTAVFEKLQKFEPVAGWKLIQGREGNRRWKDEVAVGELIQSLRIPKGEAFTSSLKSPTQMEKAGLSEKKWEKLKAQITRSEGKVTAVSETDSHPAYVPTNAADFENHDIGDLL